MLKPEDALIKLSSSDRGMPKSAPRRQNRQSAAAEGWRYALPFVTAPLLLLFAITLCAAFVADEAAIGYISLSSFALFLYAWYAAYRAALDSLYKREDMAGAFVAVIREGEELLIPSEDLVVGDILLLRQGDRLFADCRVLDCRELSVKEWRGGAYRSLDKRAQACDGSLDTADNMLWTDSVVTSGDARALVVAVGDGRQRAPRTDAPIKVLSAYEGKLKRLSLIASISLLGVLFFAAVFGLTPLSSGGLWRDWLIAVSFAATSALELLTVILTVALGRATAASRTVIVKDRAMLERLAAVDHMILPAKALWDTLRFEAEGLLLPTRSGAVTESLSFAPSEAGARLLKNAVLTARAFENGENFPLLFQKTFSMPLAALCEAHTLTYADTAEEVGTAALEPSVFCRVFERGGNRFVALCGDCRYLLSLTGFLYCGDTIAPYRAVEGADFLKEGAIGVAIGSLPKDTPLDSASLMRALAGRLVFEGAILTKPDTSDLSACQNAFARADCSLGIVCESAAEYAYLKKITASLPIELVWLTDPAALSLHIEAKKQAGKTVLCESDIRFGAADHADLTAFSTELVKREAQNPALYPALSRHGASDTRFSADCLYQGDASALAECKRLTADAYDRVTRAAAYLVSALLLKFFPTVFAIILGEDLVSPLFFVLMGLGFDTLAVFSILYRPRASVLHRFEEHALWQRMMPSVASGAVASLATMIFSLVAAHRFSLSAEVFSTLTLLAASLAAFWLQYFQMRALSSPTASLGTALTVGSGILLFVLLFARGSFGKFGLLFLAVTVLLLVAVELVLRLILKKINRKGAKKVKNRAKNTQKRLDKQRKV